LGPYYRRPWFAVLMAALIGLMVWLAYRIKVHQLHLQFRAVTAERNRVAREIHDTLLQGCIAVYSLLETYITGKEHLDDGGIEDESHNALLEHARNQIVETISEARTAIWNVRQAESSESLNELLRGLLDRLVTRTEVIARYEESGLPVRLDAEAQHELAMATREAILNALAHGRPNEIGLKIANDLKDGLLVEVADNGMGFDVSEERMSDPRHFGLAGLRERLLRIDGSCIIHSRRGGGTRVELRLPARLVRAEQNQV
jgi:signal transduction histidine kinase